MKTGIYTFEGIDIPVNVVSIHELRDLMSEEDFGQFCGRAITLGGFWATEVTQEVIDASMSIFAEKASDDFKLGITSARLGKTICCVDEIASKLSQVELHAILKHEEGHVVLDHAGKAAASVINGIIVNDLFEIEADAYSVKSYGKEALRSAILKIINLQARYCAASRTEKSQDEFFHELLTDSMLQKRLAALA